MSDDFTPIRLPQLGATTSAHDSFAQLALARRSVRDFADVPVPDDALREAVRLAQLSPSACNRQPCRVYAVTESARMAELLEFKTAIAASGTASRCC